jgi:hypothetical protein
LPTGLLSPFSLSLFGWHVCSCESCRMKVAAAAAGRHAASVRCAVHSSRRHHVPVRSFIIDRSMLTARAHTGHPTGQWDAPRCNGPMFGAQLDTVHGSDFNFVGFDEQTIAQRLVRGAPLRAVSALMCVPCRARSGLTWAPFAPSCASSQASVTPRC